MQRVFVNINFPEPKGASQLVCHLFAGPESCTLKPNRPLSDPQGTELQQPPLTLKDQYCPPPPKKDSVHLWPHTFCQQAHGLRW